MNSFKGKIKFVQKSEGVNVFKIFVKDYLLNVMTLSLDGDYSKGANVEAFFKETEVGLAKDMKGFLSFGNVIPSKIIKITEGELFARVRLESKIGEICALVLKEFVILASLNEGDAVLAIVKANEISLAKGA